MISRTAGRSAIARPRALENGSVSHFRHLKTRKSYLPLFAGSSYATPRQNLYPCSIRVTHQAQRELLRFIHSYRKREGISPGFEEMAAYSGRLISTMHDLVNQLVAKGYVRKSAKRARSVEIVRAEAEEVAWPCVENEYRIPPGAKFVRVEALEGLFSAWLRRRLNSGDGLE